jgi:hypothetical protein
MSLLLFKKCFLEAIRAGQKRSTIRRWRTPRVRAGGRAFSPGLGWVNIENVDVVSLRELNDWDARVDGFASAMQMRRELKKIYPHSKSDGKRWFRVRFKFVDGTCPECGIAIAGKPGS